MLQLIFGEECSLYEQKTKEMKESKQTVTETVNKILKLFMMSF